ncbi:hypothetical protein VTL71DRAFT_2368 [Oculimacula yallundae]|uniref:Uncharacterized protein n=1 Tax=Oculimacula yallundae TaxID=86028 RepID=A0ABR4C9E8_9HELO
MATILPSRDKL